jgi:hypothetical protein
VGGRGRGKGVGGPNSVCTYELKNK